MEHHLVSATNHATPRPSRGLVMLRVLDLRFGGRGCVEQGSSKVCPRLGRSAHVQVQKVRRYP